MTIPLPVTHFTVCCKECKHFKPYFEKCKMFTKRNIVTGKIEEAPAIVARDNRKMCGYEGKYFESCVQESDSSTPDQTEN
jgi:hypothetical protein